MAGFKPLNRIVRAFIHGGTRSRHLVEEGIRQHLAPGGDPYFLHPDGIVVADEKPENWMKDDLGQIVPIDLILVDLRVNSD